MGAGGGWTLVVGGRWHELPTWLKPVKQAMATMALMPHGSSSQLMMRAVCVDTIGFWG